MMHQAPFWRKLDKLAYVVGTSLIICYSSLMGRYPHDLIYSFVSVLLPALILPRVIEYTIKGWHYFLIDFCYFVNSSLVYFLMAGSSSQSLFVSCFVFSNGPLSAAIVAFRNSLVYHKIDYLTSLAIHAVPMTIMTHIRWYTIPQQASLPKSQQRFPFEQPEPQSFSEVLTTFIAGPMKFYCLYLVVYGVVNFVVMAKTIKEKKYYTTYTHFYAVPWIKKVLDTLGPAFAPVLFMIAHGIYVLATVLIGTCCFYSYHFNMLMNTFLLAVSFYNGANFYMESFSRKYEK